MTAFSLARYLGTWAVVAHIPAPFSAVCGDSPQTAEYSMRQDGRISVVNRCAGAEARGVATVPRPEEPYRLLVDFGYGPASYVVELVDPSYRAALVGNDDRSLLWILARPEVPRREALAFAAQYIEAAKAFGYPVGKLVWIGGA